MNPFKNKGKNHKIELLKAQKLLLFCHSALLPFCLTGCMGVYEGGFECPPGEGVGCKSISEVNQMVDQGLSQDEPMIWYAPEASCTQCSAPPLHENDPQPLDLRKGKRPHVQDSI